VLCFARAAAHFFKPLWLLLAAGNGRIMPGAGCLVSAVQTAAGREALVVGKGGPFLLPFLQRKYSMDPSKVQSAALALACNLALSSHPPFTLGLAWNLSLSYRK
jgi:hypothetical protein